MRLLTIGGQVLGILLLIPVVALGTLRYANQNADGPSILFPGGELVSGELYAGPEPDWRFTHQISTVELQLNDPPSSRLIWILESGGRLYVASGYMSTALGRLWKHWAVRADAGDGQVVVRIDGTRYERQLVRIKSGPVLDGVAAAMRTKYRAPASRADIEAGNTWIFELAPTDPAASVGRGTDG
jgi:hypothetical protein